MKKSGNLLIFINLDDSKNLQFAKFQKLPNWKVPKISNFENSKNLPNSTIWKTKNFINFQFYKLSYILSVKIMCISTEFKGWNCEFSKLFVNSILHSSHNFASSLHFSFDINQLRPLLFSICLQYFSDFP